MSNRLLRYFLVTSLIGILFAQFSFAAASGGTIEGRVRDSQTGDPLPGANVMLVKTSLGASTDIEGRYTIRDILGRLVYAQGYICWLY